VEFTGTVLKVSSYKRVKMQQNKTKQKQKFCGVFSSAMKIKAYIMNEQIIRVLT